MQYPYLTIVGWAPNTLTAQHVEQIMAKIVQLKSENRTDGDLLQSNGKSHRRWATREDAQAWIDWLETLPGLAMATKTISED